MHCSSHRSSVRREGCLPKVGKEMRGVPRHQLEPGMHRCLANGHVMLCGRRASMALSDLTVHPTDEEMGERSDVLDRYSQELRQTTEP